MFMNHFHSKKWQTKIFVHQQYSLSFLEQSLMTNVNFNHLFRKNILDFAHSVPSSTAVAWSSKTPSGRASYHT